MSSTEQQQNLASVISGLPPKSLANLAEGDLVILLYQISEPFGLTIREIGWLCETVRQVIAKEIAVEQFTDTLRPLLDEDNQPRANAIAAEVMNKIFSKLLPALGIKIPVSLLKPELKLLTGTLADSTGSPQAVSAPLASVPNGSPQASTTLPASQTLLPKPELLLEEKADSTSSPQADSIPRQDLGQVSSPQVNVIPIRRITSAAPAAGAAGIVTATPKVSPPQPSVPPSFSPLPTPPVPTTKPPRIEAGVFGILTPAAMPSTENPLESLFKMVASRKMSESELNVRFENLPDGLKNALLSVDSAKKIADIGRKYALHIDKLGELGSETGLVLLGITHPGQFISRLAHHLAMSEEQVRPIAQDINAEVFLKIREALKAIHGEGRAKVLPAAAEQPQEESVSEETLDRGTILHDIEEPPKASFYPTAKLQPESYSTVKTEPAGEKIPESPYAFVREITEPPKIPPPPLPLIPPQTSEPENLPTGSKSQSIVEQKLSGTTVTARSERKYTTDPYREPLG